MQKTLEKDWLVITPQGVDIHTALIQACRGHRNLARALYYYLYVARYAVQDQGIDKEKTKQVTLPKKSQDEMLQGLEKYAKFKTSKKTFIALNGKLNEYGFVISNGRRQTYSVHWGVVQDAINNPPPPDPPKLRGRHAPKDQKVKRTIEDLTNTNKEVKSSIQAQNGEDFTNCSFEESDPRIVNLQLAIEDLTTTSVNLTQRIVNLQLEKSQDAARIADLEAKLESLYKLINSNNFIHTNSLSADGKSKHRSSGKIVSLSDRKQAVTQPVLPTTEFTEREQAIYDAWSSMKWFHGIPPKITEVLKGHVKTLAQYEPLPTANEMYQVRAWAEQGKKLQGKKLQGWELGNVVHFYPKWLSAEYTPAPQKQTTPEQVPTEVYWNDFGLPTCGNVHAWRWMPYAEAISNNYDPERPLPQETIERYEQKKAAKAARDAAAVAVM